jgi:uncharacterized membrane protein YsdA (DUF1294 family)/cold shock CspA family protein
MKSGLHRGQLVKWKDDRGFGFIQPVNGGKEVFLHISELSQATRRPQVGDTIDYHLDVSANKVRAIKALIVSVVGTASGVNSGINRPARPARPAAPSKIHSRGVPTSANRAVSSAIASTISIEAFPYWQALMLATVPLIGAIQLMKELGNPLPLALYPAMSLVTYALYRDDKARAQKGSWRIPEKNLHLCELAGGWLGGFVAQRKLHHKNRKSSYQLTFWAIVIVHQLFWIGQLAGWI